MAQKEKKTKKAPAGNQDYVNAKIPKDVYSALSDYSVKTETTHGGVMRLALRMYLVGKGYNNLKID